MHIIVIAQKDQSPQNSYAENISHLLKECAKQNSHAIIETVDISSIKKNLLPENFFLFFFIENKNAVSLKWFYDVQLLSIAKKLHADLVVDLNGCCSRTLKLPQILVLQDIFHLHSEKLKMNVVEKYSMKNATVFLNKTSLIISCSDVLKKLIEEKYDFSKEKIKTVYPSANNFYRSVESKFREAIKEKYADGKEYFISKKSAGENEFVNILKAFSVFKKWQHSNMKLLLMDFNVNEKILLKEKLETYKYRNDVHLIKITDENKCAELLASSYALLHFSNKDGGLMMPANALQCCVPVISSQRGSVEEICGEAALYAENETPQSVGKQMVILYKDEKLRNEMIQAAAKTAGKFNVEKNVLQMWKLISGYI